MRDKERADFFLDALDFRGKRVQCIMYVGDSYLVAHSLYRNLGEKTEWDLVHTGGLRLQIEDVFLNKSQDDLDPERTIWTVRVKGRVV